MMDAEDKSSKGPRKWKRSGGSKNVLHSKRNMLSQEMKLSGDMKTHGWRMKTQTGSQTSNTSTPRSFIEVGPERNLGSPISGITEDEIDTSVSGYAGGGKYDESKERTKGSGVKFARPVFIWRNGSKDVTTQGGEPLGYTPENMTPRSEEGGDGSIIDVMTSSWCCASWRYKWNKAFFALNLNGLPLFPSEFDDHYKQPVRKSIFRRTNEVLTRPEESKVALFVNFLVFSMIIISSGTFIVETMPSTKVWSPECAGCMPVRVVDRYDADGNITQAFADRLDLEEFCRQNKCEPEINSTCIMIETIAVIVFSIEYLLRLFTCWSTRSAFEMTTDPAIFVNPITGLRSDIKVDLDDLYEFGTYKYTKRIMYFLVDGMNIIDLLAVVPYYVQLFSDSESANLVFFRLLRLFRIIRLLRVLVTVSRVKRTDAAYMYMSETLLMTFDVFKRAYRSLVVAFLYTVFFMLVFAALAFTAERGSWDPATGEYLVQDLYYLNPPSPSLFVSIPATFWWVLVTFTTVGYGDISPTTTWGRVIGVFVMYSGVMVIALPITIISTTFRDLYDDLERRRIEANETFIKNGVNFLDCFITVNYPVMRSLFRRWLAFTKELMKIEPLIPVLTHLDDVKAEIKKDQQDLSAKLAELTELVLSESKRLQQLIENQKS